MTVICPYCKAPLKGEATLPRLSGRNLRVYRALVAAGPEGIESDELLVQMYDDDEYPTPGGPTVLRVQIHDINRKIAGTKQRIINWHRKRYRLVSVKESRNGKTVKEKKFG
jgi:hypothetical protein